MSCEKGLSQSLKYQAEKYLKGSGIKTEPPLLVEGMAIDYPYSEVRYASWNAYVPEGVWKSYEAMKKLFDPQSLPKTWIAFIKEVSKERKAKGCNCPVNLVDGLFFLTEDFPSA